MTEAAMERGASPSADLTPDDFPPDDFSEEFEPLEGGAAEVSAPFAEDGETPNDDPATPPAQRRRRPARRDDAENTLAQEMDAARAVINTLREVYDDPDDADLLADMIEGETGLFEALDGIVGRIFIVEAMADALKDAEAQLKQRRERFEHRVGKMKTAVEVALLMVGKRTIERPIATLSLVENKPPLEITDESAIPADYFKKGKPVLEKAKLKAALEALAKKNSEPGAKREEIPGAALGDAATTLRIHRR